MVKNKFKWNLRIHIILFHIDALLFVIGPKETQEWFLMLMLFEASMIFFHIVLRNKG